MHLISIRKKRGRVVAGRWKMKRRQVLSYSLGIADSKPSAWHMTGVQWLFSELWCYLSGVWIPVPWPTGPDTPPKSLGPLSPSFPLPSHAYLWVPKLTSPTQVRTVSEMNYHHQRGFQTPVVQLVWGSLDVPEQFQCSSPRGQCLQKQSKRVQGSQNLEREGLSMASLCDQAGEIICLLVIFI